ncbi:MAG: hypothetical protein Kow0069_13480 [Promethearchaeota archaeon]
MREKRTYYWQVTIVGLLLVGFWTPAAASAPLITAEGREHSQAESLLLSGYHAHYGHVFLAPVRNQMWAITGAGTTSGRFTTSSADGTLGTWTTVDVAPWQNISNYWPQYDGFYGTFSNSPVDYDDYLWVRWENVTANAVASGVYNTSYARDGYAMLVGEERFLPFDTEVPVELNLWTSKPGLIVLWIDNTFGNDGNEIIVQGLVDPDGNSIGFTQGAVVGTGLNRPYVLFLADAKGWYQFTFTFAGIDQIGTMYLKAELLPADSLDLGDEVKVTPKQLFPTAAEAEQAEFFMTAYKVPVEAFHLYEANLDLWQGTVGDVSLNVFYPTGYGPMATRVVPAAVGNRLYFGPRNIGDELPVTADGFVYVVLSADQYQNQLHELWFSMSEVTPLPHKLGTAQTFTIPGFERVFIKVNESETFYGYKTTTIKGAPNFAGPQTRQNIIGAKNYLWNPQFDNFGVLDGTSFTCNLFPGGIAYWTAVATTSLEAKVELNTTLFSNTPTIAKHSPVDPDDVPLCSDLTQVTLPYSPLLDRAEPALLKATLNPFSRARMNVTFYASQQALLSTNNTQKPLVAYYVNSTEATTGNPYAAFTPIDVSAPFNISEVLRTGDYFLFGSPTLFKGFKADVVNNGTGITFADPEYWDGDVNNWRPSTNFNSRVFASTDQWGNHYGNASTGLEIYFDPQLTGAIDWEEDTEVDLNGETPPAVNNTAPLYWMRVRVTGGQATNSSPTWDNFRLVDYVEVQIPSNTLDIEMLVDGSAPDYLYSDDSDNFLTVSTSTTVFNNYDDYQSDAPVVLVNSWLHSVPPNVLIKPYNTSTYLEAEFQKNVENNANWEGTGGVLCVGIVDLDSMMEPMTHFIGETPPYSLDTAPGAGEDTPWQTYYNFYHEFNATENAYNPWGIQAGVLLYVTGTQFAWTQSALSLINATSHVAYVIQEYPMLQNNQFGAYRVLAAHVANRSVFEWGCLSNPFYVFLAPDSTWSNGTVGVRFSLTQYATPVLSWSRVSLNPASAAVGTPAWVWWTVGIAGGVAVGAVVAVVVIKKRKSPF